MSNISFPMYKLGHTKSAIREVSEYGRTLKAKLGADSVFDFSLGNPNVPAPDCVNEALLRLIQNKASTILHGYTASQGDQSVRTSIAENLNMRFNTRFSCNNIYMTSGAAAALAICFHAIIEPGDEILTFAPFFSEYRILSEAAGATFMTVPTDSSFMPDTNTLEDTITIRTKALIINSPNNPTGVVYPEKIIKAIAEVLNRKSQEYGHPIFLISDEPYREIVYDNEAVPYVTNYYDNTLVCYSFSKCLSLPGERIGYIVVPSECFDYTMMYEAVCGSGRSLGYVCAPSLFQFAIAECLGQTSDISIYKKNRDILFSALTSLGFECIYPKGAFYLFMKVPDNYSASDFCIKARKYNLLFVPGDSFGSSGYVRISYCVDTDMIQRSLPFFELLANDLRLA
ncbi:MAG: pyridoxal phosphate-dependent aminotransferase [Bacteroides sp.]